MHTPNITLVKMRTSSPPNTSKEKLPVKETKKTTKERIINKNKNKKEASNTQDKDNDTTINNKSSFQLKSTLLRRTNIVPLPLRVERNSRTHELVLTSPRQKYHPPREKLDSSGLSCSTSTTKLTVSASKLPRVATLPQKNHQHILTRSTSKHGTKKESVIMRRKTISSSSNSNKTTTPTRKSPHDRRKHLQPCSTPPQTPTQFDLFSVSVNAPTSASVSRYQSHPYAKIDWEDEESICTKFPYIPTKGALSVPKGLVESRTTWLDKARIVREWRGLGYMEQADLGRQWTTHRRSSQMPSHSTEGRHLCTINPQRIIFPLDTPSEIINEPNVVIAKEQEQAS